MALFSRKRRASIRTWNLTLSPKTWRPPSSRRASDKRKDDAPFLSKFYSMVSSVGKKIGVGDKSVVIMKKSQYVIVPTSLQWWQVLLAIVMVYCSVVLPFEIAELPLVRMHTFRTFIFWTNRIADLVLLADLVLNFFLALYDTKRDMWITNHGYVVRSYLKGMFVPDLVATFPFDLLSFTLLGTPDYTETGLYKALSVLMVLRLMRLLRWIKLETVFVSLRNEINWDYSLATLCKYGLYVVLIIHWMACAWWYMGELEMLFYPDMENWLLTFFDNYHLDPPRPHDKYVASCYWSVMTASTVGYSGLPSTTAECIFLCVMMLGAAFIFGFIIGTVAGITSTRSRKAVQMYQIMDDVAHFSESCKLPKRLRKKLENYFQYRCTQAADHDYAQLLLHQMVPSLQQEVSQYTDSKWLTRIPVFAEAPTALISKVAMAMQQQLYPPTEILFQRGDKINRLLIIMRGIVVSAGQIHVKGHILGDEALLKHHISMCGARSMTYSEVNEISITTIQAILGGFPTFKQHLRLMATKKVMRHEVQAYAEAVRRMELIGEELSQAMQENRSPNRLKSRFPSVFTSSGTVTGSFMSNDSSDDGDAVEGAIPDISEKYILDSLQETKPDSSGRVAHYMHKIGRYIQLSNMNNQKMIMATVRIQRAWRRAQAKKAKQEVEQAQGILRWATFMLKIAGAESAMTAYWMDIAHQQLKEMNIEDENDVQRIFQKMDMQGYVDYDYILEESKAEKKWGRVKSMVRNAIPLMNTGSPKRAAARTQEGKTGQEDADGEHQAKEVMFNIALNIIRWKKHALEGHKNDPKKEEIGLKPKPRHWKALMLVSKAATSRKTIKIAGAEWVIDGRLDRPSMSSKPKRKKSLRTNRTTPGSSLRGPSEKGQQTPKKLRAPLHELLRMESFKAAPQTQNMYRGSRATTADLVGNRRSNFKVF